VDPVGLTCFIQVVPPSLVTRMVPSPTTQPRCASAKAMSLSVALVPLGGEDQPSKCA
jgi:hypothetical protein